MSASAGETAESKLAAVLARFPTAYVLAIDESGTVVPMPQGVPLIDHCPLPSTFDSVVPADRVTAIGIYARARAGGVASGTVRLVERPDRPYTAYVIDCRARFGVLVAVLGDGSDDTRFVDESALPPLPARLARAHKDGAAIFISVDTAFGDILGWEPDELIGRRALELIHPDDHDTGIANWIDTVATPGPGRRVRLRHKHRDGRWVWLEVINHNRLDNPDHADVVADMVDISEEMAAQEALRAREELLFELAETVPVGQFHCDRDGNIVFANTRLSEILRVDHMVTIADLIDAVHPEDRLMVEGATEAALGGRGDSDLELRLSPESDMRYATLCLRSIVRSAGGLSGIIGCLEDVTDNVLMRQHLELRATFDPLTDCRNRASAMAILSAGIDELRDPRSAGIAVIYVDLDQFKPVNDAFGHATGDQLLMVVSERLRRAVRAKDVVGRIGGDEFMVICPGVNSPDDALRIAQVVTDRLCATAQIVDIEIPIRASVGVVWTDDTESDAELLVAAADAAMYSSKRDNQCRAVLAENVKSDLMATK